MPSGRPGITPTKPITIRFHLDTAVMLEELSDAFQLSQTQVLNQILRKYYPELMARKRKEIIYRA